MGAAKITPGVSAPVSQKQIRIPFQRLDRSTPSPGVAATGHNKFGGVVTPVNVRNLYQVLSNRPKRAFVAKLSSKLREEAKIGYSDARRPRFIFTQLTDCIIRKRGLVNSDGICMADINQNKVELLVAYTC